MSRKKKYAEYPDGWPEHRILYVEGSCFEPQGSPHHYIINPVNDIGFIETNVFNTVAMKWPHVYEYYRSQPMTLGSVQFVEIAPDKTILTMIVQHGAFNAILRDADFQYEVLRECFLKTLLLTHGVGTYHMTKPRVRTNIFPWKYPLGDWLKIAKIIDETFILVKSKVYVYKESWRI